MNTRERNMLRVLISKLTEELYWQINACYDLSEPYKPDKVKEGCEELLHELEAQESALLARIDKLISKI